MTLERHSSIQLIRCLAALVGRKSNLADDGYGSFWHRRGGEMKRQTVNKLIHFIQHQLVSDRRSE